MPYSGTKDKSLPSKVKKMPSKDKKKWVATFNSAYSACTSGKAKPKDGQDCEGYAFAVAYSSVKRNKSMKTGLFGAITEFVDGISKTFSKFQQRAISISSVGSAVFDELYNQGAYLTDLYFDGGGMIAVANKGGKLFRASIDIDTNGDVEIGDLQEVIVEFNPVNRTTLQTDKSGKVRMIAVSATSVLNKDGAIDSRDLFDSMSSYLHDTGKKIPRTFCHAGNEFRTGDIIFMARDDNVLITITEFDDTELAQREIKTRTKEPEYWGDSIEFDPVGDPELYDVGDGITIPVYRSGIPLAVSTVPAHLASSPYANKFSIQTQEVKRMTLQDFQKNALVDKYFDGDEEEAENWLKDNVSTINRNIADTGQINRNTDTELVDEEEPVEDEIEEPEDSAEDLETEEPEEESSEEEESAEEEPEEEEPADELVLEWDDEMAAEVANSVVASSTFAEFKQTVTDALDGFKEQLAEMGSNLQELQAASVKRTKEIKALQKAEDEKHEEWVQDLPRNQARTVKIYRPSEDAEEVDPKSRPMNEIAEETLANIK